jgi:hypothetical protein
MNSDTPRHPEPEGNTWQDWQVAVRFCGLSEKLLEEKFCLIQERGNLILITSK